MSTLSFSTSSLSFYLKILNDGFNLFYFCFERISSHEAHVIVCKNRFSACEQGVTPPCHLTGSRHSCGKAGRIESVLFLLYTWQPYFTTSWPSPALNTADKCQAPPGSLSTTDPPDSLPSWSNLTIAMLNHLSTSYQHFLHSQTLATPFPQITAILLPRWPRPPVQTMKHIHVIVRLDPSYTNCQHTTPKQHQNSKLQPQLEMSDFAKETFHLFGSSQWASLDYIVTVDCTSSHWHAQCIHTYSISRTNAQSAYFITSKSHSYASTAPVLQPEKLLAGGLLSLWSGFIKACRATRYYEECSSYHYEIKAR